MKIYSSEMIKVKLVRQKKAGKVLYLGLLVLVAFVVGCVLALFCQKVIMKRATVRLFGVTPFVVTSGSMQPTIQVSDIIFVKKSAENKIKEGDIITFFDRDGNIVTHRVAEIVVEDGVTRYLTKGDANNAEDSDSVPYQDVIGRYRLRIPNGARVTAVITSPFAIVLFVILVILIALISYRNSRRRAARHTIREKLKEQHGISEKIKTE